jgi:hypothetical protein
MVLSFEGGGAIGSEKQILNTREFHQPNPQDFTDGKKQTEKDH